MRLNPLSRVSSPRLRRGIIAGAALTLTSGMIVAVANQAMAATGCSVTYSANSWSNGFTASVSITNLGDPLTSWQLEFDFPGNQTVTQAWSSKVSQSGQHVTLSNEAYNGNLGTNASVNPGFNGSYSGTNTNPSSFTLNGVTCNGSSSTTDPTTNPPTTNPPTTNPPTTNPPTGDHVDNPYVGASKWYVNPEWSAKAAAEPGGSAIADQPTGVWLDSIASITAAAGSTYQTSLREHLDGALDQGADLIQFVIYDLPGRDCSALASNGELGPDEIDRYRTEYIDPIAAIMGDSKYSDLRIVNIVEIDSLPNLITNVTDRGDAGTELCDTMRDNGNYVAGIQYAVGTLHAAGSNIYNYIDAGHHGWLGWDDNFGATAELLASTTQGASGGFDTVDGFITDTANYSALEEPYVKVSSTVGGQSVRQSDWVDWNQYNDELSFAQAFRSELVSQGFNSNIGMLIDTSRNGWGGSERPTASSSSSDMNTWVDESRIDRRIHKGNWCNQSGAGIGERPTAAPASGIDAYTWIKPPGESDGSSSEIPNESGKGFDRMCDPTYEGNARNGNSMSGALPDAPISGAWFSAQFQELIQNAYPAL